MSSMSRVKETLSDYEPGEPFSIRNHLHCGTRAAVDKSFARLVKDGVIVRLAIGVYMLNNDLARRPSVEEIAWVKAAAFGREKLPRSRNFMSRPTAQASSQMETIEASTQSDANKSIQNITVSFATPGPSSQFKYAGILIVFKQQCQRKIELFRSKAGSLLARLWHHKIDAPEIEAIIENERFSSKLKKQIITIIGRAAKLLPAWLKDLLQDLMKC